MCRCICICIDRMYKLSSSAPPPDSCSRWPMVPTADAAMNSSRSSLPCSNRCCGAGTPSFVSTSARRSRQVQPLPGRTSQWAPPAVRTTILIPDPAECSERGSRARAAHLRFYTRSFCKDILSQHGEGMGRGCAYIEGF